MGQFAAERVAFVVLRLKPRRSVIVNDSDQRLDAQVIRVLERIEAHLAALRNGATQQAREWLTIRDAAEVLKVSSDTIERLIAGGKLQASEIATGEGTGMRHRYRIRRAWLDAFLLAGANAPPSRSQRSQITRGAGSIDFIGD